MLVYALVNKQRRIYVGMAQVLSKRLTDHNYGRVFSTKGLDLGKFYIAKNVEIVKMPGLEKNI